MNAKIICKKHDIEGRLIYPVHEKDESTGQTALQTYVDTYKTAPVNSSAHPTLRRAEILQRELSVGSPPRSSASEETSCCRCGVAYSVSSFQPHRFCSGDGTLLTSLRTSFRSRNGGRRRAPLERLSAIGAGSNQHD